jgi:hypothetical protein
MQRALMRAETSDADLIKQLHATRQKLIDLNQEVNGNPAKGEIGERNPPSVQSRMFVGIRGLRTTYGPTAMHQQSVEIAEKQIAGIITKLQAINSTEIPALESALITAGAPWIEGQPIPKAEN